MIAYAFKHPTWPQLQCMLAIARGTQKAWRRQHLHKAARRIEGNIIRAGWADVDFDGELKLTALGVEVLNHLQGANHNDEAPT